MEKGIYNGFYQYLIGHFEKEHLPERTFEPIELLAKRARAFQEFTLKGLPSNRYEDWKYTNLNRLLKDDFRFQPLGVVSGYDVPEIPDLDACRIVLLNGRVVPDLSDPLPEGVRFFDTQSALQQPAYVKKLGSLAVNEDNPVLDLNTAFFRDFAVLHVAAKKLIDKPIHIVHHFSGNAAPAFVAYRMLVLAENLSETTLIETFHSRNEHPVLISYISEHEIAGSAVLHSHLVNALDEQVFLLHHREVDQHQNSVVNNMNISLGEADLVRNELNFRLKGSGTETNLWGSYVTSGRQHLDNHTVVDHQQPHCNSSELYKGIMTDRSHAVFNGKVIVRPDAQKTNAFQQNNNILLSDQAAVDSKPQLEIFADDVKCSHGSTVGQLNEEALFYLRTRGIGEDMARRILVEAFVSEVHSRIPIQALKDYVLKLLKHKLQSENLITA